MNLLSNLKNTHRKKQKVQRVGRGIGSGRGVTSTRGQKGAKARSGYKRRAWQEGGNVPLFKKLPTRGFNNARFATRYEIMNLDMIEKHFEEGETLSLMTLREKGLIRGKTLPRLKILGNGELTKKLKIEAHAFTASAKEKLDKAGVEYINIQVDEPKPTEKS